MKQYDFYKGDTYIGFGTVEDMANQLGIKPKSLSWMCTPVARSRRKYKSQWFKLRIQEDDL